MYFDCHVSEERRADLAFAGHLFPALLPLLLPLRQRRPIEGHEPRHIVVTDLRRVGGGIADRADGSVGGGTLCFYSLPSSMRAVLIPLTTGVLAAHHGGCENGRIGGTCYRQNAVGTVRFPFFPFLPSSRCFTQIRG